MSPPSPEAPWLLLDCGHTALKALRWDGREVSGPALYLAHGDGDYGPLAAYCEGLAAAYLLPGGGAAAAAVQAWWGDRSPPLRALGFDLPLPDYGQYAGCGADRICAAAAALQHWPAAVLLQCGTATTVSAWRRMEGRAQFLGGMILPSAAACAQGLAMSVPALPAFSLPPTLAQPNHASQANPLAQSTSEACSQGLAIAYPAMLKAAVEAAVRAAAVETVVISGGAAAGWLASLPAAWHYRPGLTLEGLGLIARSY